MMSPWHWTRHTALVIGVVALVALLGTGAVMAAQTHMGPFSASSALSAQSSHTNQSEPGEDQHLAGTIQSVDQTGQTFVLAPDDGSTAVIIAFDANTNIEKENGTNPLAAGAHVNVETLKRSDGSLYAKEIKLIQNDQNEDERLVGTIQSVDQAGQTFVLAPDDGSAAVTIAFDTKTNIEHEDGDNGGNPLVTGAHVRVEVLKRSDGSLYATEIQGLSSGHGDGDGNGGSGDGGSGGSGGNDGSGGGGSDGGGSSGGSGGGSGDGGSGGGSSGGGSGN